MSEENISLAMSLWTLAENFNSENYIDEAHELKVIFANYRKKQSEEDQLEIDTYLESIGG